MKRKQLRTGRAPARLLVATIALGLAVAPGTVRAVDSCLTPHPGDVYYVVYQNSPAGPEYIVDLGPKDQFFNATTKLTFPDVRAADLSTVLSSSAPNIWAALFGVRNPVSRDAIVSANGPKDQVALENSSIIGAAQQIDSWATGLPQFASPIGGPPCSMNAGTFPGRVFGSYQDTLNGSSQGSISGNLVWRVETRLSNSSGVRTATAKIRFFDAQSNPALGTSSSSPVGYFKVYTDGTTEFWPDRDGDLLPDVPIGSDPEADKCPGVNNPDNTDADGDGFAAPCDCDDHNPNVHPGATEVCNGIDDNCDGQVDEVTGSAVLCNDDNPCTTDTCGGTAGCVFTNNTNPCDDGNACTTSDTCGGGTCNGTSVSCDDGNACSIDSCDPGTGACTHVHSDSCHAEIAATGTCNDFTHGTAPDLTQASYLTKGTALNSSSPGVMVYFSTIIAPSASFTFAVNEAITPNSACIFPNWPALAPQSLAQANLYSATCQNRPSSSSFDPTTGTLTMSVTGATPGETLVVGIKYRTQDLKGTNVCRPHPIETYTFSDSVGNSDTLVFVPKN